MSHLTFSQHGTIAVQQVFEVFGTDFVVSIFKLPWSSTDQALTWQKPCFDEVGLAS